MSRGYQFYDGRHMEKQFICPRCEVPTFAFEDKSCVFYGRRYICLHTKEIVGRYVDGYIFCNKCFLDVQIEGSIYNEDEMNND